MKITQCHFPSAKIKKIIQQNQQIGKLCSSVPFLVEKSLEIFLNEVLDNVEEIAIQRQANKLTPAILKKALEKTKYDFLKDSLSEVEDLDPTVKKRKSKVVTEDAPIKKKRKNNHDNTNE